MKDAAMRLREGGCLCGNVRFRAEGEATDRCFCHCRSCQLATGSAGVAWATFDRSGWSVTQGEVAEVSSSEGVTRGFCASCGTALTYSRDATAGEIDVTVSTFDSSAGLEPESHIFVSEKPGWLKLDDGLPQYRTLRGLEGKNRD